MNETIKVKCPKCGEEITVAVIEKPVYVPPAICPLSPKTYAPPYFCTCGSAYYAYCFLGSAVIPG